LPTIEQGGSVEYVVVAVVAAVAILVIGNDALAKRRYLRTRVDVPRLVAERAASSPVMLGGPTLRSLEDIDRSVTRDEGEPALSGVWRHIVEQLDPEHLRPKLAEGSEIKYFRMRWGDDYAMLAKADHSAHYQLQVWEGKLIESLDGTRDVGQIVVDHLTTSGDFDAGAVIGLIEWLRLVGFFEDPPLDVAALVRTRAVMATSGLRRLKEFAKTLRLSWTGADPFIRRLYEGGVKHLFRPPAVALGLVISLGGLIAFVTALASGRYQVVVGNATLQTLLMMALGFVLTAAHELGHASTLVHYRRKVLGAGFQLYYGTPTFFIDTSDGLMLGRGPRVLQALAGPFAESVLAGVSSMLLFAFPQGHVANFLYKFSVLNYYVIFLNLIPLLELDGYWVLADGIEVPDLRPRSIAFIRKEMWQKIGRRERFSLQEIALGSYGVLGIAFTALASIAGLVLWQRVFGGIIAELWDSGFATRVLMLILIFFFTAPAIRGLISLARAVGRRVASVWRRIQFRFETTWRVEAAELIDALPAFADLPVDALNDLAGRVQLKEYGRDECVFRQGDAPDAFYVVRSGTVAVEDQDPETGDVRTIRTLSRGEAFGESALLDASRRQATIRVVGDPAQLFRVDKNAFDRLLADAIDAPSFAPTMQAFAELRELSPFQRLTSKDLSELLAHGRWVKAAPGEMLVREGAVGDAFYVISSGHAEVVRGDAVVNELGQGAYFGEVALLEDIPRTASVVAKTPLRAFRLDREGFDQIVATSFKTGTLRRAADRERDH
jgi:CRP-like cAMP-binding protein/Zn-dependent protease